MFSKELKQFQRSMSFSNMVCIFFKLSVFQLSTPPLTFGPRACLSLLTMSSSGSLVLSGAGGWQDGRVLFVGQQCVRGENETRRWLCSSFRRLHGPTYLRVSSLLLGASPQLFLLRPVRPAAGHSDGPRRRRQSDLLVWQSALHGVLGLDRQGHHSVLIIHSPWKFDTMWMYVNVGIDAYICRCVWLHLCFCVCA